MGLDPKNGLPQLPNDDSEQTEGEIGGDGGMAQGRGGSCPALIGIDLAVRTDGPVLGLNFLLVMMLLSIAFLGGGDVQALRRRGPPGPVMGLNFLLVMLRRLHFYLHLCQYYSVGKIDMIYQSTVQK